MSMIHSPWSARGRPSAAVQKTGDNNGASAASARSCFLDN
jgi:hypothetical protein